MVIAKVNPGSYQQITELATTENKDIIQVEYEKLGVTHIDVGVALLEKWGIPGLITQCIKKHHDANHLGPYAVETSIVFLANQLSRLELDHEEDVDAEEHIAGHLQSIHNWEQTKCTAGQIAVACYLADEQWLEVMESLGMIDLDIDGDLEETYLFNTHVERL